MYWFSQIHKVRQIASTLLETPRTRKGQLALRAEEYLSAFLDVLMKLERVAPGSSSTNGGDMPTTSSEEDDEVELQHWADLREHQKRFATEGGFLSLT